MTVVVTGAGFCDDGEGACALECCAGEESGGDCSAVCADKLAGKNNARQTASEKDFASAWWTKREDDD
jgi:hypothetical protein